MPTALKYIVDEKGYKTNVLVPIKKWDELNDKYKKLINKLAVLQGIEKGFAEVDNREEKPLQTLADFLNESNH